MKPDTFLNQLDHDQIVAAIHAAETRTSGEIRVFISHRPQKDPLAVAREQFVKLGMIQTVARNGILIYVAPLSRNFAILGDTGIHARCDETFWTDVALTMEKHFRSGEFTAGIVTAVRRAGDLLAEHFPRQPNDQNELPNTVATDQ